MAILNPNSTIIITFTQVPDIGTNIILKPGIEFNFVETKSQPGEVTVGDPKLSLSLFLQQLQITFTDDYLITDVFEGTYDSGFFTATFRHVDFNFFDDYTTTILNGVSFQIINEPAPPPTQEELVQQALEKAKQTGGLNDLRRYTFLLNDFILNQTGNTMDYKIKHAIDVIQDTYGDVVSVDQKKKDLTKFGRNENVGSAGYSTIWFTGQDQDNETYVADNVNSIDTISCSEANTQVVRIEGHIMTAGEKTFVFQTVTLDGQNKVTLTTPLNRVTRVLHNNESEVDLTGEIYVYEDTAISVGKPTDTTKIHLTVPNGSNQSQKASTSLSSSDYWIISTFSAGYLTKTGSNVTEVQMQVRLSGGVWRPLSNPIVLRTGEEVSRDFNPYLIIPKNADARMVAISSGSGQIITGDMQGYLAIVTI